MNPLNRVLSPQHSSTGWKERLSVWIRGNLFIPDPRVSWVRPSVKFLSNVIKEKSIDIIITSGPPHSMHLIGLQLKKRTGIKWVADFRDPWTGIDFYNDLMLTDRSDKRHRKLEKEVLNNADRIITVGQGCASNLSGISGREIDIIHNGFDETDFTDSYETDRKIFRVTHTGALNRDRNPNAFWEAWKSLADKNEVFREKSEIRLAGMVDASVLTKTEELGIGMNVKVLGYLQHSEAIAEMAAASLLLLPVNRTTSSSMIVTGKVFEYLASGKPVLAICDPESELRSMINEDSRSLSVDFDDKDSMEEYLLSRFNEFLKGGEVKKPEQDNRFSRKNLTGKLASILNSL